MDISEKLNTIKRWHTKTRALNQIQTLTEMGYDKELVITTVFTNNCAFTNAGYLVDHVNAKLGIISPDEIEPDPAKQSVNPKDKKISNPPPEKEEEELPKLTAKKMTLLEETRRLYASARCVCGEMKTHVLLPCSHLECCKRCADTKKSCPRCKEKITDVIQTYMS